MPDEPPEAAPNGITSSVIRESRKAAVAIGLNDAQNATRWMVFILISAVLGLAGWLGMRSINSFETVVSMILRSKEDSDDRNRQHFSSEAEKVREHCSKETEHAARRESERADREKAFYVDERTKDRTSGETRDRIVRDELIALRVWLGKKAPAPEDEPVIPKIKD